MLDRDLLDVYLSDHFAGATAGLDHAKRMSKDSPDVSEIAAEIQSDRQTLRDLMAALYLKPSLLKTAIGWFGEKAGRMKLNDRVFGRSPLSRLLELELLIAGVSGKLQLWRALAAVASADSRLEQFDFRRLAGAPKSNADDLKSCTNGQPARRSAAIASRARKTRFTGEISG